MARRAFSSIPERRSYAVRPSSASKNASRVSKVNSVKPKNNNANMIVNLLEFLDSSGCDARISCRDLNCPSKKMVFGIFEHILRQIDPNFSLPSLNNELDECFVGTLRYFGYPGTLNKSMVSTPGAQHSWPHVLSALDWMILEHQRNETLIENDEIFIRTDNQVHSEPPIAKTIWNFCLKSLADEGNCGKYIRELSEYVDLAYGCSSAQIQEVEKRKADLEAELASIRISVDEDSLQQAITNAKLGQQQAIEEANRLIFESKEVQTRVDVLKTRSDELETEKKTLKDSVNEIEILVTSQGNSLEGLVQKYKLLKERYDQRVLLMNELSSELQTLSLECARLKNYIAPALDKYNRLASSLVVLKLESKLPLRLFVSEFDDTAEVPVMSSQLKEVQKELHSLLANLERQMENITASKRDSTNLIHRKQAEIQSLKDKIYQEKMKEQEMEKSFNSGRTLFGKWESEIDSRILEAETSLMQKNSAHESLVNSIKQFQASYEYYADLNKHIREKTSKLLTDVQDFLSTLRIRAEVLSSHSVAKSDASKALQREICDSYDALDDELAQVFLEIDKLEAEVDI